MYTFFISRQFSTFLSSIYLIPCHFLPHFLWKLIKSSHCAGRIPCSTSLPYVQHMLYAVVLCDVYTCMFFLSSVWLCGCFHVWEPLSESFSFYIAYVCWSSFHVYVDVYGNTMTCTCRKKGVTSPYALHECTCIYMYMYMYMYYQQARETSHAFGKFYLFQNTQLVRCVNMYMYAYGYYEIPVIMSFWLSRSAS